jgi:hypothetical protein
MLNSLYNFALNPAQKINDIMQDRRVWPAFLGYGAGALSIIMMIALESGSNATPAWFAFGLLGILFFDLCLGFFFAASSHLFLELTTGKGRAAGLFVLIGLSEFTKTLLVAFAMAALAMPQILPFRILAVLVVLCLQIFVVLYMMHKAYGLSKTGTFFAMALSFVPSIISLLTIGFLFITFIFWLIFK